MICQVILRYSHIFPRELFWLKHLMSFYYLAIKYSIKFLSRNCSDFRSVVVITNASHAEGRQFNSGRKQLFYIIFIFMLKNMAEKIFSDLHLFSSFMCACTE